MECQINIAGIANDSIVDGPGIRVCIFCQGCPHACEGCHNPETHAFGVGTSMTVQELYDTVLANPLVKGVTFSGGEPFCQAEGFAQLAVKLREHGYELAAYTGYTFEQLQAGTPAQQKLLSLLDVLIDGPFELAERNLLLRFRGSAKQRIIDVPNSLVNGKVVLCTQERWTGVS